MFKQKRGLSAIVVTLIIILLAIAAFAIVSSFFTGEVEQRTEDAQLSSQCLDVSFESVQAVNASNGDYNVTISRGASGEIADGAQVVLSGGGDSASGEITEDIDSLETVTEQVSFTDGGNLDFTPETVEAYPYFEREDGSQYTCDQSSDSQDITN